MTSATDKSVSPSHRISVRQLAEVVCRSGDLFPTNGGWPVDAQTGIDCQQAFQQQHRTHPDYSREVKVTADITLNADTTHHMQALRLSGRMDGFQALDEETLIEEFKTTARLPEVPATQDMAQVLIYGGLLARENASSKMFLVRLIYVTPEVQSSTDLKHARVFELHLTDAQLQATLTLVVTCYCLQLERHLARRSALSQWQQNLEFPFSNYRTGQRALSRRVFKGVQSKEHLLVEAPTGAGKSMGTLFPAVRGLSSNGRVFFATSRNLGAKAAASALSLIDPEQRRLNWVHIQAREKVCLVEGMPCRADLCRYAAGYYNRIGDALNDLIASTVADADTLQQVAQRHEVCPHELSLDATNWSDVLVGDYNYLFSPDARLQRLIGDEDLVLLIDEAHQLAPRVSDMLDTRVSRDEVKAAMLEGPSSLLVGLKALDRSMLRVAKQARSEPAPQSVLDDEHWLPVDGLATFTRAAEKAVDSIHQQQPDLAAMPAVQTLYFSLLRWLKAEDYLDKCAWFACVEGSGKKHQFAVARRCVDPAPWIRHVLDEHQASVRFSGTLTPLDIYQSLHGCADQPAERAPSPFAAEQLQVYVVTDVSTFYRDREQTSDTLAQLITGLTSLGGRFLVTLPSYAYLNQVRSKVEDALERMQLHAIEGQLDAINESAVPVVLYQQGGQDMATHEQTLQDFRAAENAVLFTVLGGVFAESLDFADTRINGIVVIGLGVPPPDLHQRQVLTWHEQQAAASNARTIAYTQPAMAKVVQAAGRLVRDEADRGLLVLIDPRFNQTQVRQFMPPLWQPQHLAAQNVLAHAREFFGVTESSD